MTLRITPHRQLELSQFYTQDHLAKSAALQNQISSGQRIHKPSDDPEGQRTVLYQEAGIARLNTQIDAIEYARANLNQSNSEVLNANRLLVQAKSLALEARQTTEQSGLDVIAAELDGYLKTLDGIANSKLNGRYLFGGVQNDKVPYTGIVDGSVQYQGSSQHGEVILAQEDEVAAFLAGDEVFEFVNDQGNARINVFETIRTLRDDLHKRDSFTAAEWGDQVGQHLDKLEQSSNHLLTVVGEQSVSLQQLDRLQTRA